MLMNLVFIAFPSLILNCSFYFLSLTLFLAAVLLSRPNWACKHLCFAHQGDERGTTDWRLHWWKVSNSYLIWVYFALLLVCLTCRCTNRPKSTCQPSNSKENSEKSTRIFLSRPLVTSAWVFYPTDMHRVRMHLNNNFSLCACTFWLNSVRALALCVPLSTLGATHLSKISHCKLLGCGEGHFSFLKIMSSMF